MIGTFLGLWFLGSCLLAPIVGIAMRGRPPKQRRLRAKF